MYKLVFLTALDGGELYLVRTPAYEKGTDRLLSINYQKVGPHQIKQLL